MNRVEEITIVGGGTAGWLVATSLVSILNIPNNNRNPVKVRLIESPNVPTIGVGESTLPIIPYLLQSLGIDEKQFILQTNATFKCAGRFVHWNVDSNKQPVTAYTPFNGGEPILGFHPAYYFLRYGRGADGRRLGGANLIDAIVPNQAVIDNFRGPRELHMNDYEMVIGYAYHLDAGLFAKQLKAIGLQRGVEHILDDVDAVTLDDEGYVAALQLREHGDTPVQFVIDCSGFKGLIIRQALGEPFEAYREYFPCDSAYPVMVPYDDNTKIRPATTATGMNAGWRWEVPLYNRKGAGYVFASDYTSEQDAIDQLMQALGNPQPLNNPRVIRFQTGATRRAWVKNCLAIGLSGGFVEPLEATAIGMIDKVIRWFVQYYPRGKKNPLMAEQLNKLVGLMQSESRDFIFMHYYLSNRNDTEFWKTVSHDLKVPDSLQEKLDLWREVLPSPDSTLQHQMFDWENYMFALFGKGYFDDLEMPISASLGENYWRQYTEFIDGVKNQMVKRLPSHYDLLTSIRDNAQKQAQH